MNLSFAGFALIWPLHKNRVRKLQPAAHPGQHGRRLFARLLGLPHERLWLGLVSLPQRPLRAQVLALRHVGQLRGRQVRMKALQTILVILVSLFCKLPHPTGPTPQRGPTHIHPLTPFTLFTIFTIFTILTPFTSLIPLTPPTLLTPPGHSGGGPTRPDGAMHSPDSIRFDEIWKTLEKTKKMSPI
jgi:hypothetical protein